MKTPLPLFTAFSAMLLAAAAGQPADLSAPTVTLRDFKLVGDLGGGGAAFTLTATAHVANARGGSLDLLSGPVALTAFDPHPREHIRASQNQFSLTFDHAGEFPIRVKFSAAVSQSEGWNTVDFRVAPSVLQPIVLHGLPADTQFQFAGAARPDRKEGDFLSYLPADGAVKFSWKEARPETEGKLFFSAGMLSQISVSPGLMRQIALLDFKVMQGELNRVSLRLRGAGEVTRVQGEQVLAWSVEPLTNSPDRRLVIQLNQPQKDQFAFQVPLSARFRRRRTSSPTVLPAPTWPCASRRTKSCLPWPSRNCWPIAWAKTRWRWTRNWSWIFATRPCANC
ncbi:MAG: hypothetical protein ACLQVY_12615 [Limisphaerales bacterium]